MVVVPDLHRILADVFARIFHGFFDGVGASARIMAVRIIAAAHLAVPGTGLAQIIDRIGDL